MKRCSKALAFSSYIPVAVSSTDFAQSIHQARTAHAGVALEADFGVARAAVAGTAFVENMFGAGNVVFVNSRL